jgi:hypothetical protein
MQNILAHAVAQALRDFPGQRGHLIGIANGLPQVTEEYRRGLLMQLAYVNAAIKRLRAGDGL